MASSQVETVSSSPPFANHQKNLKDLVIHSCKSDPKGDSSASKEQKSNNVVDKIQEKKFKIQQRWVQAREMVCNSPKFENGFKNHKKAKLTREMVCNMLQIDNDDFSIKGSEHNNDKDKTQKKPNAQENEKSSIKENNQNGNLKEMVSNILQIDNLDRSAKVDNEKNHELKRIREIVSSHVQNDSKKFERKPTIQERWARAREKVCNQPQSDNDVSNGHSKEKNYNNSHSVCDNDKNASKNQEPWARVRENVSKNSQKDNVDKNHKSKVESEDYPIQESNDKKLIKSKSNKEDSYAQEDMKSKDNKHKKSKSTIEDICIPKESKSNDKNLKKVKTQDRWARARDLVSGVSSPLLGGGVSSLLQKWKGYEAEAKSLNSNKSTNTSPGCSLKSNLGIPFIDNSTSTNGEPPSKTSPSSEYSEPAYVDERENNAFSDWESDKFSYSAPPSCTGRDSDIASEDKEKVRVVDVIRKLTSTKGTQQVCNDDEQMLSSNESLPRAGSDICPCPRVRGRKAISNFLIQIERSRQRELESLGERKPVSKFSQKGRIQAVLKVRLMNRLAKIGERVTPNSPVSAYLKRGPQGSHIMHIRERFIKRIEHGSKETPPIAPNTKNSPSTSTKFKEESHHNNGGDRNNVESNPSSPNQPNLVVTIPKGRDKDIVHNVQSVESSSVTDQLKENKPMLQPCEDVEAKREHNPCKVKNQGKIGEESTSIVLKSPSYEVSNTESIDEEIDDEDQSGSDSDHIKETPHTQTIWEDIESCHDWLSDISQLRSEWEQMCNDQQLVETNHDWISEVARPRSDWEDLRQARYQEMLDPYAQNGDIRQLLERKSVSSFLSSDMRDTIDRLMMSRMQKQSPPVRTSVAICKEEAEEDKYDQSTYEDHSSYDNEDSNEQSVDLQFDEFSEFSEYSNQTYNPPEPHSKSLLSPWMDIQGIAVSDYSDPSTPYSQKFLPCNTPYRDNIQHFSPFINSPSIEMELIYDLREHMEQLHEEIYEIRTSIKSCIGMQEKLQRSIKHSVGKRKKGPGRRAKRKEKCCICNEKRVDSLLYRCGHMCTCFKCAHEVQMSTGRCPICETPILDIVRPCRDNK